MSHHVYPFDDPAVNCAVGEFLRIDSDSLQKMPLDKNYAVYLQLSVKIVSLIVDGLTEEQLFHLLPIFLKELKHFSVRNMTVLQEEVALINQLPKGLESLEIIDSRFPLRLLNRWFNSLNDSMKRIYLCRSNYRLSLNCKSSITDLLFKFSSLREISVQDTVNKTTFKNCHSKLETLVYDMPSDDLKDFMMYNASRNTIKTMGLRRFPKGANMLKDFGRLENLKILNPILKEEMNELKQMRKWTKLEVQVTTDRPKPDLLMMLNHDCLAHIFTYLKFDQWLELARMKKRFREVVQSYLDSKAELIIKDETMAKYQSEVGLGVLFNKWAPSAKGLKLYPMTAYKWSSILPSFQALKKLTLYQSTMNDRVLDTIPDGLYKLELLETKMISTKLTNVLARLSDTLREFHFEGPLGVVDISVLRHIKDIKVLESRFADLGKFMEFNRPHLERIDVECHSPTWLSGGPFPSLRVLRLSYLKVFRVEAKDFPNLKELSFSFQDGTAPVNEILGQIVGICSLERFKIKVGNGIPCNLQLLHQLVTLKHLMIREKSVSEMEILNFVEHLPQLKELGTTQVVFSLAFEVDLQRNLRASNRSLILFNSEKPKVRMTFE